MRRFTNITGRLWMLFILTFLLSCSDNDGESYPRYRADYYDLYIDADSVVTSLTLDDGKTFVVEDQENFKAYVCDTTIRCFGTVEISKDSSSIQIHSINQVNCFAPSTPETYKKDIFYKNPTNILAIYKARSYINLILTYKLSGNVDHAFDFIKDSITENNGYKTIHLTLFHWHPDNETEAYTQKYYMSLPLGKQYYKPTEDFDSVEICINTKEKLLRYKFER